MVSIKCPSCQSENPDNSRFCRHCAFPLISADEKTPSATRTIGPSEQKLSRGALFGGKYRILHALGRGGMGLVYKAEDIKLKRTVALKFLSPELTQSPEARERFIHEAQAASALDHPHICTVYEIDESDDGQMYIAMAFYEGDSLKERIRQGPMSLKATLEIGIQVAEGLARAHEKDIVHRDIKPANIMLTREGTAKIVDFGLAKLAGTTRITRTGKTLGTVAYMSPEQILGEEIDSRSDVWSLGVLLYEMITGELPFRGENEQAIIYSILYEEPKAVKKLIKPIPAELERILRRALTKKPEKRYPTAKEVAESLKELKAQVTQGTIQAKRQLIFHRRRRKLWIGAMAGVLVLVAFLVTWIMTRPTLAFQNRDKLLVADVENLTGDSVFELALRTAIEADLQQSPYVSIFDRNQVAETLRMMRVEPSSRIDETLGIEICRFAGIRALILPRILGAGRAYELQAILIDPVRKRQVDRIRVKAIGKEEVLLHGIDALAQKTRSRLGESLESIQKADVPLVKATTSSWEALHYLAMGQAKWHEGKFKDAGAFFELALEKDSHFVSARGSLGLVMIQWLGQKEKGREMLRQALEDAEGFPQREYLAIRVVNKQYVDGDLEGALAEYRMMREIFPDTMIAYNNPGTILRSMGRYDEAVELFEKASEVAPTNSLPLANLWWTHLSFRKDPLAAEKVARRLVNLSPMLAVHHHWLGYALAAQGKFEEAISAYKKALALDAQHPYALPNMAHLLVAVGRAAESVPYYRKVLDLVKRKKIPGYAPFSCFELAFALREAGEMEKAAAVAEEGKNLLLGLMKASSPQAWVLLTMAQLEAVIGHITEAEKYLKRALDSNIPDLQTRLYLAEVYALLGRSKEAVATLKEVLDGGYSDPYFPLIYPAFHSLRQSPKFRVLFGLE